MKAMILSAGRGKRLRPLTDTTPKPLIIVQKKPLIVHHIECLAEAGIRDIVINLAYLGEKIQKTLGNGSQWGVNILYSQEPEGGLEVAGGIINALPLLGTDPFITVNADIFTDFDFSTAIAQNKQRKTEILAHLILVPITPYHTQGDFSLHEGLISNDFPRPYIASGITFYQHEFFKNLLPGRQPAGPLWRQYADQKKISGEVFEGFWHDIGSVEKLNALLKKELQDK